MVRQVHFGCYSQGDLGTRGLPLASKHPSPPAYPIISSSPGIRCSSFLSDQHQMSLSIHQHFFLVLLTCPEGSWE